MQYKNIKFQTGRSMIEMLGVLAIMAVITVLSIMAYNMAIKQLKVNQIKNDVGVIAQQVRVMYPQNNYIGLNDGVTSGYSPTLFKKRFVDSGLLKNDKNPFGGHYMVLPLAVGGNANTVNYFRVIVVGITKSQALLLEAQNWDGTFPDPLLGKSAGCSEHSTIIPCSTASPTTDFILLFR